MYCRKCGNELNDSAKFCNKCGINLITGEQNEDNKGNEKIYKNYYFKSDTNTCVTIDYDKITIKRSGIRSMSRYGLKGEKTMMINQISSVQFKKAGLMQGYLQFILVGSQESKGGLSDAKSDENAIIFSTNAGNRDALEIKKYIEDFNSNHNNNEIIVNNIIKEDKYDKLEKIKKLYDDKVLSEEEYNKEKEKIMNQE